MTSTIQKLSICDSRWSEFIRGQELASIFHHPAWISTLTQCHGHPSFLMALVGQQGEILAGIPVMHIKSWLTGARWVSFPFSDYCPPLARSQSDLNSLLKGLLRTSKEEGLPKIEIRWHAAVAEGYESMNQYVLHSLNLEAGLEQLGENCNKKFRQYPRRAERFGLEVTSTGRPEDIEAFYKLHLKTRKKLGVPIQPRSYFELLDANLIQKGFGKIIVLSYQQEPISAAIMLFFNKRCMIKYSASDPAHLDTRCQYLLFWKCIEWSCKQAHSYMDFGKTELGDEGLRYFKNGWGTKEEYLPYSYAGASCPKERSGRLDRISRPIIQRSPEWVGQMVGELLYRHFA
jgi:CelD/BcsL family acetyltransferase involved in cellulose biosynthesis